MHFQNTKFVISCLIAFGLAASKPREARADGEAYIILDAEVNQCIQDCMARKPAFLGDVNECRAKLSSCQSLNEAWRVAYGKLVEKCGNKFQKLEKPSEPKPVAKKPAPVVVDDKPKPPPPPQREVVICEGGATKSDNGKYCVCPEGVPARLVSIKDEPGVKHATCVYTVEDVRKIVDGLDDKFKAVCNPGFAELDRPADLLASCELAGKDLNEVVLWYRSLVSAKLKDGKPAPLNKESWEAVFERVGDLMQRLTGLEGRVKNLEDTLCAPFPDEPKASMRDRCVCPAIPGKPDATKEERCAPPRATTGGPFKGGMELQILAGAHGSIRPDPGTDTSAGLMALNLIGWAGQRDGIGVGGIVGPAWNRDSNRLGAGARVFGIHAFDDERTFAFRYGVKMTAEPGTRGNEATNVVPEVGLQMRPAKRFVCDLGAGLGGSKVATYVGGRRTGERPLGLVIDVGVDCGLSVEW